MNVNEEKRAKFIDCAGKRVNNVLHDMQILEPMARSSVYDFTREDIEEMFSAMQETLDNTKAEFYKKFEEKVRSEKKVFSFGNKSVVASAEPVNESPIAQAISAAVAVTEVAEATAVETNDVTVINETSENIEANSANESLIF